MMIKNVKNNYEAFALCVSSLFPKRRTVELNTMINFYIC